MRASLGPLALLLALVLLPACQSVPLSPEQAADDRPAKFEWADFKREDAIYTIDVYDPFEPVNRGIFKFNAMFDRALLLPVTELYEFVVPPFVQDRVSDFFSNLSELTTFANSILQAKIERASRALVRFVVNSTLGLAGLFDVMTTLGTAQQREDFGQTLGVWGAGEGPFMMLPFFGPSNLRDTAGLIGDTAAYMVVDPFGLATLEANRREITGLRIVDTRSGIDFRYHETGSPFEYDLLRLLYTEKRRLDIAK